MHERTNVNSGIVLQALYRIGSLAFRLRPFRIVSLAAGLGVLLLASETSFAAVGYWIWQTDGGDCSTIGSWNGTSGTCTLSGDVAVAGKNGIRIASPGVTLDGGGYTVSGDGTSGTTGIHISAQDNAWVRNLTVTGFNYGIHVDSSDGSIVQNNSMSGNATGLFIDRSTNGNFSENIMTGNDRSFKIQAQDAAQYSHSINTTNRVEGRPLYYIVGAQDQTYGSETNAGAFYCVSCQNVTIRDLAITGELRGIVLAYSSACSVEDSTLSDSTFLLTGTTDSDITGNTVDGGNHGVFLYSSSGNTLSGNDLSDHEYAAITLSGSADNSAGSGSNIIERNSIDHSGTNGYGIELTNGSHANTIRENSIQYASPGLRLFDSNANTIYRNNFLYNTVQAQMSYSPCTTGFCLQYNYFSDPSEGGNYWSDFDTPGEGCDDTSPADDYCDAPYVFTGNQDDMARTALFVPSTPFWSGAADLGGGWMWLDWFGYFSPGTDPWIYHMEHGFLHPFGDSETSVVFWDAAMNAFWWTSDTQYPYIYRFSDGEWLWYQEGTTGPRWFNKLSDLSWEEW